MSEALRLAKALEYGIYDARMAQEMDRAAIELRRLHAENERLREALQRILDLSPDESATEWNSALLHAAAAILK